MRPILLLTRPEPSSGHFAGLAARECPPHQTLIAPLSQIAPVPFDPAMLDGAAGVILTSANAARFLPPCPGLPAWCVGAATTEAARRAGFDARNGGGDAEALIKTLMARRPAGRLVHAQGRHLARDIAAALEPAGLTITALPVYEARALDWPPRILTALKSAQRVVVPLFSPRTARRFVQSLGPVRPADLRIVAISAACAAQLPRDLQARTVTAARPDAPAMLAQVASELSQASPGPLRV